MKTLQWRHNGRDGVSNHQPCECLLGRPIRRRSEKTSTPRVTGLCVGNSPETGEFPAQMTSKAENVSIWWRHHYVLQKYSQYDGTDIIQEQVDLYLHIDKLAPNLFTWIHNKTLILILFNHYLTYTAMEFRTCHQHNQGTWNPQYFVKYYLIMSELILRLIPHFRR